MDFKALTIFHGTVTKKSYLIQAGHIFNAGARSRTKNH